MVGSDDVKSGEVDKTEETTDDSNEKSFVETNEKQHEIMKSTDLDITTDEKEVVGFSKIKEEITENVDENSENTSENFNQDSGIKNNENLENMVGSDDVKSSEVDKTEETTDDLDEKSLLETNEKQNEIMKSTDLDITTDEKEVVDFSKIKEEITENVDENSESSSENSNSDCKNNEILEKKQNIDNVSLQNENDVKLEKTETTSLKDSDQLKYEKAVEIATEEDEVVLADTQTASSSIEDIPLSPYKNEPIASKDSSLVSQMKANDGGVAVMDVDDNSKGDHAGIITSDIQKKQQNLVDTSQSSVVDLEEEIKKESSVVCGAGKCVIS